MSLSKTPCVKSASLAAVFLTALALHLLGAWAFPLVDRDEPRFAEASREMIQRGDFITPYFNGQPRYDKPPLIYWLQAAAFQIIGASEFSARLPSAWAAALAALFVSLFASRFAMANGEQGAARAGFWAATLFTFCLQVIAHAKAAVADMAMISCVAGGYWAAWESSRAKGAALAGWFTGLTAALGLGFLAKGPIAWAPLLLLALSLRASGRRRLAFILPPLALAFSLGIVALWGVPALDATKGEFFHVGIGKHVIQRGISAQEGHGSANLTEYILLLPFYFVTIFVSFLPWSTALPGWLRSVWRKERPIAEYPMLWTAGVVFTLFTLYKTKLPHYTLPAFPLLALMLSRYLLERGYSDCWLRRKLLVMWLLVCFITLAGPFGDYFFPSKRVAEVALPYLGADGEFASTDYREPSLVWYMRRGTTSLHQIVKPREAVRFLSNTEKPRLLVLSEESARDISGLNDFPLLGTVEGINLARGRKVKLMIYTNRTCEGKPAG